MLEDKILGLLPSTLPAVIGDLPGTTQDSICIMLYDGNANTEYFGPAADSTVYQPVVKIVVRSADYEKASNWVRMVKEALHRHVDDYFMSILLVGSPMYLGKSEQKLHEFQETFKIQVKE